MKRQSWGCRGKISYTTHALANGAKQAMHAKDRGHHGAMLNVFACQQCSGFHIGRKRRSGYGAGTPDYRKDSQKSRKARYIALTEADQ